MHSPHNPCMCTLLLGIVVQEVKVSAVIALTKSAAKTRCMPTQHVAGAEVERKVFTQKREEVQRENKLIWGAYPANNCTM